MCVMYEVCTCFCVWCLVCALVACVWYVYECIVHVWRVWYVGGVLLNAAWLLAVPPDQGILL